MPRRLALLLSSLSEALDQQPTLVQLDFGVSSKGGVDQQQL